MTNKICSKIAAGCLGFSVAAALMTSATESSAAQNRYAQSNLVSDLPGVAQLQDTNLVNSWGVSFSTNSPFWIADNSTGVSTLYVITNDSTGAPVVNRQGLVVNIPPGAGQSSPTGTVFNNLGGFNGDSFLFVSEDGTISGWHGGVNAETLVPGITNNVYKGMTLTTNSDGTPILLAANFRQGTVDEYGSTNFNLIRQFADTNAPAGFAPFGMQSVNGTIYVTFAKQDDVKHDDVAGRGNGLIDTFDPLSGTFTRFATGTGIRHGNVSAMNSPWGIAMAPDSFGIHGGQLLVGNFGDGTIMAFDAVKHKFKGTLNAVKGGSVKIDGLWAITFGNGGRGGDTNTLYFTSGPGGESHGLMGQLVPFVKQKP
jgi:uncharacterized protein (TIGR03118 family)